MKTNRMSAVISVIAVAIVLTWSVVSAAETERLFSMWQPHRSTPGELLRSAAYEGNIAEMKRLLSQGTAVEARDKEGWTPLIWAQAGNRPDAVTLLMAHGADIDAKDHMGYTALHQACTAGRVAVMAVLLAAGADLENVGQTGTTPLMDAALYGRTVAVELLLAHGADPNAISVDGHTAVALAEKRGHRNVAMLLVANGADPLLQGRKLQVALAGVHSRPRGPSRVRLAGNLRNTEVLEELCRECLSRHADAQVTLLSGHESDAGGKFAAWCRQSGFNRSRGAKEATGDVQDRGNEHRNAQGAKAAEQDGAAHLLRQAIDAWESIQAKYPDADKLLRERSRKGIALDKVSSREPLLQRALGIWQTLQSEHPDLAAHLMSMAGMNR